MSVPDDKLDQILERIDTLIAIQALAAVAHLQTKREKILFLSEAGLAPKAIAPVVGTTPAAASQVIYEAKKVKAGAK